MQHWPMRVSCIAKKNQAYGCGCSVLKDREKIPKSLDLSIAVTKTKKRFTCFIYEVIHAESNVK